MYPGTRDSGLFDVMQQVWRTGVPLRHPVSIYEDERVSLWVDNYICKLPTGEIVAVFEDITGRKRAEQEREDLEHQLRQSQKLEAVGQLAGGVAHDFNNLLTAITGYADLIEPALSHDAESAKALRGIQDAARQAAGVTRSLLTFSSKIPARKDRVDLCHLVRKTAHLLERMVPATISVRTDVGDGSPIHLTADSTQLQQVIMNLSVNARDAMPDGGELLIRAEELHADGLSATARTEGAQRGRFARLTVSDTGIGMPQGIQDRVFEPFFTTKVRERGTGLGLAIVRGIVNDHGGHIEFDSDPGQGTTFEITLPIFQVDDGAAPDEPVRPTTRAGQELVLLAEDNWNVRSLLAESLRRTGFRVVEAADGEELLERYAEHISDIRLLVLDVDLPRRSGLDCLQEIRAQGLDIPALIITGGVEPLLEDRLDAHTFLLRKPFNMSDLQRLAVELVLERTLEEVEV